MNGPCGNCGFGYDTPNHTEGCVLGRHPNHDSLDEALGCSWCQASYRNNAPVQHPDTIKLIAAPPAQQTLSSQVGELESWWLGVAREEIEQTIPKAIEYGSAELEAMGREILGLRTAEAVSRAEALEAAIFVYLRGKVGRWYAALRRGERVSDDTLHDLAVYARMAQRVRAVGGWPFEDGTRPHQGLKEEQ